MVVEAVSLKELSDTEVWGNIHATYDGMTATLRCAVPEISRFGIRCNTATDEEEVYLNDGRDGKWVIEGPILPNDSVVVWWRSTEDDRPAAATGVPKPNGGGRGPAAVAGGGTTTVSPKPPTTGGRAKGKGNQAGE